MGSTYERSFLKGVVWEGISFIITTIAVFLFYGNLLISIQFSIGLTLIKMFFFFAHERFWKTIKWGKKK
jgi:hypothetical protein